MSSWRRPESGIEVAVDNTLTSSRELTVRSIRQYGDPILRTKAKPVEQFDEELRIEVDRMKTLLNETDSVGLAGPQVGLLRRIIVYRVEEEGPVYELINLTIESVSKKTETAVEGCKSIQDVWVEVERPAVVTVHGYNVDGEELRFKATGLMARCIQHEVDHLNGILMIDRVSKEQRREALRMMVMGDQRY